MSHSNIQSLVKMINQISSNNEWHGIDDKAIHKVSSHIHRFWARSMKQSIIEYYDNDGSELSELSRRALDDLRKHATV